MKVEAKRVHFLLSFGHCGIDWVHSLLNGHKQLLVMPEFSYYRLWRYRKLHRLKTSEEVIKFWSNLILLSDDYQTEGTKFFANKEQETIFRETFSNLVYQYGIERKQVFYALHEAFATARGIDLDTIQGIIVHEHVCFTYDLYAEDFKEELSLLFIVRDPRAALAGYLKGFERKFVNKDFLYDLYYDYCFEEWLMALDIYKNVKSSDSAYCYVIRNEDLSQEIEPTVNRLANWLGINNEESLLRSKNSFGGPWKIDSNFVKQEEKVDNTKAFFNEKLVRDRWKTVLNEKDVVVIEHVLSDVFDLFGYKRDYSKNFFNRVLASFYFFRPHYGIQRYCPKLLKINSWNMSMIEKHGYGPTVLSSFFMSIFNKIKMIHIPGKRWDRYKVM